MTSHVRTNLKTVTLPATPNAYLLAPEGYCKSAKPHDVAPEFNLSPAQLWDALLRYVGQEPRITLHDQDKHAGYLEYTQRSAVFRFPDRIVINVLSAAAAGKSTIAVFSRSKYGRSDLGANKARVKRLIAELSS